MTERVAVVTGASAGIGAATAAALAGEGFRLILGARRLDRLRRVAEPLGAAAHPLDVTDPQSISDFCRAVDRVDLLVNNAGVALGLDPIAGADDAQWEAMYRTNVLGVVRMTRELLPRLEEVRGHVVVVGSTAGFETYPGGGGYTASKHALRAVTRTLRQELLGHPVRVTEICPGLVDTEFSHVRFAGDRERAELVYRGMQPLVGADVAECIRWAASLPPHVNVDEIVVRPRDQASVREVHRRSPDAGSR